MLELLLLLLLLILVGVFAKWEKSWLEVYILVLRHAYVWMKSANEHLSSLSSPSPLPLTLRSHFHFHVPVVDLSYSIVLTLPHQSHGCKWSICHGDKHLQYQFEPTRWWKVWCKGVSLWKMRYLKCVWCGGVYACAHSSVCCACARAACV